MSKATGNAAHRSYIAQYQLRISGNLTPEVMVRQIIQREIKSETLPPTKRFGLFHIRGIANDSVFGGPDKDKVIYGPEFAYLLDVGWAGIPMVVLGMVFSGLGDPHFPDFNHNKVFSAAGWDPKQILFPNRPGILIIGAGPGTSKKDLRGALSDKVSSLEDLAPDMYVAGVQPFRETAISEQILKAVPSVRYAETDPLARLIDFSPGWYVDQVS